MGLTLIQDWMLTGFKVNVKRQVKRSQRKWKAKKLLEKSSLIGYLTSFKVNANPGLG